MGRGGHGGRDMEVRSMPPHHGDKGCPLADATSDLAPEIFLGEKEEKELS